MIPLIVFYSLLISFSILIFRNSYKMWKMTNDFTPVISTLIIYYFTLGASWIFPIDAYSGFKGEDLGLHYVAIFDKMFVVSFDTDYFISCAYYTLFILVFQYTYILFIKRYSNLTQVETPKRKFDIIINPYLVLALSFLFIFISAFIMRNEIYTAIANENSVYISTRANNNHLYTIHQLANEFAVLIPFIAYTFAIIKTNTLAIKVDNKKTTFYILLFTCIISSLYIGFLGNRREILSGIVICILISVNQFKNINYKKLGYIFFIVLTLFLSNRFFRSSTIPQQINSVLHLKHVDTKELETVIAKGVNPKGLYIKDDNAKVVASSILFSNELFYAHFSMYGAIHKQIPFTYGSSYVYLATALIPRAIYANRPMDIYSYYSKAINKEQEQIFTIHHATACYLNFGLFGIILGAFILGGLLVFAFLLNFFSFNNENTFLTLLKYLIPFLICGQLVTFITAGPEAYKSMILEGILIPVILLGLCSNKKLIEKE